MQSNDELFLFADISDVIRKRRYNLATKRGYLTLLRNILVMTALVLAAFRFVFSADIAVGSGMYPAVLDGDVAIGYRLGKNYLKNDVVVFDVNNQTVIGRVVAKGGDNVDITESGDLYVNGTFQQGEILFQTFPGKQEYPYTVPEGCVYILGDNRTRTYDSREFGAVSLKDIRSKVVYIFRKRGI